MRPVKLRLGLFAILVSFAIEICFSPPSRIFANAQALSTDSPNSSSESYITNTYTEPVKVRPGPSTAYYGGYGNILGYLPVGATAVAIGVSPGGDWIEISFASSASGAGWVYAPNVNLTGSLRIVEPPPTFTPYAASTLAPTLLASANPQPTLTLLPTFPPAAPLSIPTFPPSPEPPSRFPAGTIITSLLLIGALGLVASVLGRR